MQPNEIIEILDRPLSQELLARSLTHTRRARPKLLLIRGRAELDPRPGRS